ncbi:hypothetical protein FRC11_002983, partial [Ceratobasidium sp. 423]
MTPGTQASRPPATWCVHVRAQSLPNAGEHTPSSSGRCKYECMRTNWLLTLSPDVLARPAYPTPKSANRKIVPRVNPSKSHSNRGFSLDFEAPSTTGSGAHAAIDLDLSDSDDVVIAEYDSSKHKAPTRKKSFSVLYPDSEEEKEHLDENDSRVGGGKGKRVVPLEFGSGSDAASSEYSGADGEEPDGEELESGVGHQKKK